MPKPDRAMVKQNRSMKKDTIRLKSPDDIQKIRDSGRIIGDIFSYIDGISLVSLSTWEIDSLVDDFILKRKARAAFKTVRDYNYASCISLNNEVVHGIPSRKRRIKSGDIVKIDIGVVLGGYFSDACCTFIAGENIQKGRSLVQACRQSLLDVVEVLQAGKNLGIAGDFIEARAQVSGFSVVKSHTGHGVGFALHEPPIVPHYASSGQNYIMREGLVIAVEPVFNEGTGEVKLHNNGWTTLTADGKLSAHFEHTIAITDSGPVILTA